MLVDIIDRPWLTEGGLSKSCLFDLEDEVLQELKESESATHDVEIILT